MVEVWAMAPTPNSMYMAHQYRLLDCKRGFSANKSRKMVMKMFTISVVFFIFCCKFYTFFMFVCWGIVVRSAEWCSVFRSVLADRQQCLAIRSQHYCRPSAAVGVRFIVPHIRIRHAFAIRSEYIHGTFATCSFSACYIFAMQKYGFWRAKVWFLVCKKGVFELQKYGFCFFECCIVAIRSQSIRRMFATLLQFVRHASAICKQRIRIRPPRCCNPFATFWHFISSVVAICLQ